MLSSVDSRTSVRIPNSMPRYSGSGKLGAMAIRRPWRGQPRLVASARGVVFCALLALAGCISTQKIDQPPTSLREAIRNGELVEPGQHVTVVSTSRGELAFRVTEIDRNAIRGKDEEVPIEDVVALRTHRVDLLATAGLVASGYALIAVGVFLGVVLL